jgi:hypothetical protein
MVVNTLTMWSILITHNTFIIEENSEHCFGVIVYLTFSFLQPPPMKRGISVVMVAF